MEAAAAASVCLASASPRRRELLAQIGVRYVIEVADVDEAVQRGEHANDYVLRVARAKALMVRARPRAPPPSAPGGCGRRA
jgi:septum formation protein